LSVTPLEERATRLFDSPLKNRQKKNPIAQKLLFYINNYTLYERMHTSTKKYFEQLKLLIVTIISLLQKAYFTGLGVLHDDDPQTQSLIARHLLK
jgi:hypothetical protein